MTSHTIAYWHPGRRYRQRRCCMAAAARASPTERERNTRRESTSTRRKLNGGSPAYSTIDGGIKSIDPNKLIRDPFNSCKPVYPWNFIRANTIFGVIHHAGGYTAWSDKHAVYAAVSGPTGTTLPSNVDDYYSPEVNSNSIALPGVKTATGLDCAKSQQQRRRLDHRLRQHQVLRPVEGQRRPQLDQRQVPSRHQHRARARDFRHELPGGQCRPEAD